MEALKFSEEEQALNSSLDELLSEWESFIEANSNEELAQARGCKNLAELFVPDGFYPNYLNQKVKILFVGREGLGLSGCHYIEALYEAIKKDKQIGDIPLNRHRFHAMMLYISYALQNGIEKYSDIPWATEIADTFGEENGVSYAFINLSKLSNDSAEWTKDTELINGFLDISAKSHTSFMQREIALLDPDIIITLNLLGEYGAHFGKLSNFKFFGEADQVCRQTLTINGKDYVAFDTFHFSAPNKSPEQDIFNPLMQAYKNVQPAP